MENKANTKVIEIFGKELTSDNKKFIVYKAKKNDGTFISCKFTRECENAPKFVGKGFIEVASEDCNISNSGFYPSLWVQKVIKNWKEERKDSLAEF